MLSHTLARRLVVVLAALSCTACSGIGLAYRNADTLMLARLEKFVELEAEQRESLGAALEAGLERHAREDLPVLVSRMRETRSIVAAGIDHASASRLLELGRLTYRETARNLIRDVAPVLSTLDAEQIDAFETRMVEENARVRAERLGRPPGARAKRMIEGIEKWTGRLDDAQRAIVRAGETAIPSRSEAWLDFSAGQAALLVETLRAGATTDQVEARLSGWWVEEGARDPAFRALTREAVAGWVETLARLDPTLTEGQRAKALSRLDSWTKGLDGVARDARGT